MIQKPAIEEVQEEVIEHVEEELGVRPESIEPAKTSGRELVYEGVGADYDEFREGVESYNYSDDGRMAVVMGGDDPYRVHVLIETPPEGWSG